MHKKKELSAIGTKSYSLHLGKLLYLRKELSEQKHAQLSALLMQKIAKKIQILGFEKPAQKLLDKLGKPIGGLYQDITAEKTTLFIEAATEYWEKGYKKNEDHKTEAKIQKRQKTLERIAEAHKQRSQQAHNESSNTTNI